MSMSSGSSRPIPLNGTNGNDGTSGKGKLEKKNKYAKDDAAEKKKRGFFGSKK
jgi:syntaxin-binding protein 1